MDDLQIVDINGLVSACCQAPLLDGRCMRCGNEAEAEKLVIKGITMQKKPWYRAVWQSVRAIASTYWVVIAGIIVGGFLGYQFISYCGR